MPLVLGVDSSTQATKVELRDADDGTLVASARAPHPAVHPPRSEQDPESWWEALRLAVAEVTLDGSHRIDALAVAGQQHGMVVLDGADRPCSAPAKLWNDTESAPEAAALVADVGADAWATRTGSVPVAAFTVTKLAWLARNEPEAARAVRSVLLPHDYLTFRLTGRRVTDRGDASGTGYFDPSGGTWLVDLLDEVVGPADWADRLPSVLGPTEAVGPVTADALVALDVGPVGVVGPGTGDNMAAALGLGLAPGRGLHLDRHLGHRVRPQPSSHRRPDRRRGGVRRRRRRLPPAGLHAQRHPGDRRRGAPAGRDAAGFDRAGPGRPTGCLGSGPAPLPRR